MHYAEMTTDVLEEFAEAQVRWRAIRGQISAWLLLKPAPERREYKAGRQAMYDMADICARLEAGERPTRWGRRWRAAAQKLGIVCS